MDRELVVRQARSEEEVLQFFDAFSGTFNVLKTARSRRDYAEKIYQKGICFLAYLDGKLMGGITGYANDPETRCAYVTLLGVEKEARLLRGVVVRELCCAFLRYACDRGMRDLACEVRDGNPYAKNQYVQSGAVEEGRLSESSSCMKWRIGDALRKLQGGLDRRCPEGENR